MCLRDRQKPKDQKIIHIVDSFTNRDRDVMSILFLDIYW